MKLISNKYCNIILAFILFSVNDVHASLVSTEAGFKFMWNSSVSSNGKYLALLVSKRKRTQYYLYIVDVETQGVISRTHLKNISKMIYDSKIPYFFYIKFNPNNSNAVYISPTLRKESLLHCRVTAVNWRKHSISTFKGCNQFDINRAGNTLITQFAEIKNFKRRIMIVHNLKARSFKEYSLGELRLSYSRQKIYFSPNGRYIFVYDDVQRHRTSNFISIYDARDVRKLGVLRASNFKYDDKYHSIKLVKPSEDNQRVVIGISLYSSSPYQEESYDYIVLNTGNYGKKGWFKRVEEKYKGHGYVQFHIKKHMYANNRYVVMSYLGRKYNMGKHLRTVHSPNTYRFDRTITLDVQYGAHFHPLKGGKSVFITSKNSKSPTILTFYDKNFRPIMSRKHKLRIAKKIRMRKEAEEKRIRKRVRQQVAQKIKRAEDNALRIVLIKRRKHKTIQFRRQLREGDSTHCGMVIERKQTIAKLQTMIGEYWMRIDQIYPRQFAKCIFHNKVYQVPNINHSPGAL